MYISEQRLTKLLPIGVGLEIIVLILSYFESQGNITHFFQAAARLSGRVSLAFFTLFFMFATLNPAVIRGSQILKIKFIMVRDFAIIHLIHWVLLAIAVKLSGFELVPFRVAGGALAYLMVVLMPFFLTEKLLTNISLKLVQNIYIYYVWLIFFMTYLPRVLGQVPTATGTLLAYKMLLIFTLGLMFWRFHKIFLTKTI